MEKLPNEILQQILSNLQVSHLKALADYNTCTDQSSLVSRLVANSKLVLLQRMIAQSTQLSLLYIKTKEAMPGSRIDLKIRNMLLYTHTILGKLPRKLTKSTNPKYLAGKIKSASIEMESCQGLSLAYYLYTLKLFELRRLISTLYPYLAVHQTFPFTAAELKLESFLPIIEIHIEQPSEWKHKWMRQDSSIIKNDSYSSLPHVKRTKYSIEI